ASAADRAAIDLAEVWELGGKVGERFDAIVVRADDEGGEVMLLEPPVIARCSGAGLPEGQHVTVRLTGVDEAHRRIDLAYEKGHEQG
ncbi:MAG: hypothetical protein ABWY58_14175, partial [Aeromicrobium sp.]